MLKRDYKKPEILFEHMEFNTAIASACEWQAIAQCFDPTPGDGMYNGAFLTDFDGIVAMVDGEIEGCEENFYCYHVPILDESTMMNMS